MKEKDIEAMTREELMMELLNSRLRIKTLKNSLEANRLAQHGLEQELKKLEEDLEEAREKDESE